MTTTNSLSVRSCMGEALLPGLTRWAKARRDGFEDWRLQIGNPEGGTDGDAVVADVETAVAHGVAGHVGGI